MSNAGGTIDMLLLCQALRAHAGPVGPLHAWWDFIADGEALLNSERTLGHWTPQTWIAEATRLLSSHAAAG